MTRIVSIILTFVTLLSPVISSAKNPDLQSMKSRMINDLEIIRNTFEVCYAPADWKRIYAQWELYDAISKAQVKILAAENLTLKDYHHILKKFFKSTRDYHVGVRFCSTEAAYLPFRVQGAEGKYFVTWVDPEEAPKNIMVGDELLTIDEKPIHDVIQEIKDRELGNPDSQTDQAFAELFLTMRVGSLGHKIPQGPIKIITKSNQFRTSNIREQDMTIQHDLKWSSVSEKVGNGPFQAALDNILAVPTVVTASQDFFSKEMIADFYAPMKEAHHEFTQLNAQSKRKIFIGNRDSDLGPLGRIVWRSEDSNPYDAYIFITPKGDTVGYIRIPSYVGADEEAKAFSQIINQFEAHCDALVIDQQNNPGGILFHMYALGSMLTDTPLLLPTHRMTITQADVLFAVQALEILSSPQTPGKNQLPIITTETLFGYPITDSLLQSLINYFRFIIEEWNAGRTFTNPSFIYGIETLTPHPWGTFSKPILFLVNELSFSCGDFLPAVLQDNKRAVIMGTKTAGAGGYVLSHTYPNRFGVMGYTFTGSIAERIDKSVIENLGVTPDIPYELTEMDLTNNYMDFIQEIQEVLDELLDQ